METSKIITIPNHWKSPKHSLGQRTKQGIIVGIEYHPPGSSIAAQEDTSWRYALLVDEKDENLKYLLDHQIEPLTAEELRAEILAQIETQEQIIAVLSQQLIAIDQG
jgi:hypothetical protein